MAEYWIRQRTSGHIRGPVTSTQLRMLAKQGDLQPSDDIGKSRNGPWNRADSLQGLKFAGDPPLHFEPSAHSENAPAGDDEALPDFAVMMQKHSSAPDVSIEDDSDAENRVVHIAAGLRKDDDAKEQAPSRLQSLREKMKLKTDRSDNRYPALRLIAKAHQTMGVVCLFLSAISLVAFFYFLISYVMSGSSAAAAAPAAGGPQPVNLDDFADQLQKQLLQAGADIENVTRRATIMSRIWGSLIMTFGMAWGAMLCFAFAQVMMLFMDIERNTRRESDET